MSILIRKICLCFSFTAKENGNCYTYHQLSRVQSKYNRAPGNQDCVTMRAEAQPPSNRSLQSFMLPAKFTCFYPLNTLAVIHSLVCVIKTARPAAGRHMRAKDSPTSSTTSTSPMSPTSQMSPTSPIRANAGMQPRPPGSVPISRPGTASISRVDPHCATWHPGVRSTSMFSGSCKAIHGVPALSTAGQLHIC